jgi:hypothetical protein
MSIPAGQHEPIRKSEKPPGSNIEAVATQLVALIEEFEAALSEGHVPPAFAERLAELRQAAER